MNQTYNVDLILFHKSTYTTRLAKQFTHFVPVTHSPSARSVTRLKSINSHLLTYSVIQYYSTTKVKKMGDLLDGPVKFYSSIKEECKIFYDPNCLFLYF